MGMDAGVAGDFVKEDVASVALFHIAAYYSIL